MTDNEVIRKVLSGETGDFSILVEKYHHSLLGFLHRLLRDRDLAEDVGQETFLKIFKNLDRFDMARGVPFSAYLFVVARNIAISEIRKCAAKSVIFGEESVVKATIQSPEDSVLYREELDLLKSHLHQVPDPYRETLLRSLDGMSIAEIAEVEMIEAGTVKSRIYRAKSFLKNIVRNQI